MEKTRLLLVHGGTKRLSQLTQLVQDQGFEVIVSKIPSTTDTGYRAVIFAGGTIPARSYREVKTWSREFIRGLRVPFLGICLGHLMLGLAYGATYRTLPEGEYGPTPINFEEEFPLAPRIKGLTVWEDHRHELVHLPSELRNYASSQTSRVQAIKHIEKDQFGIQFHPEAEEETGGLIVLETFLRMVRQS